MTKEEQFDGDNDKKIMPLVCSTKRLSLPNADEKLPVKRRFLSPLCSKKRTEWTSRTSAATHFTNSEIF